ncbi:hypothetical protein RSAG8_09426, partial [Rhizoctonia solani AG-8 WAC10335]
MSQMAQEIGEEEKTPLWTGLSNSVKHAVNLELWDQAQGMYRDNTTPTLLPQDGNSLAIWFGVANSQEKVYRISSGLKRNWNEHGAVAPESPGIISTFISGFELLLILELGSLSGVWIRFVCCGGMSGMHHMECNLPSLKVTIRMVVVITLSKLMIHPISLTLTRGRPARPSFCHVT